jgi:hypothetical protein
MGAALAYAILYGSTIAFTLFLIALGAKVVNAGLSPFDNNKKE